ncbi:MAG TPA: hypothetical protein VMY78_05360 [Solirubrobacteraceae bacterium]|nr:hypothetical protein [Solirubrobacteraceae bacterium]
MTPIDAEDVEAAASLYAAAQLEEIGVLAVVDRLVELYLRGGLPVGGSAEAGALLDAYWLGRAERMPEDRRRALYARALGPGFEHLLGELAAAISKHDAASRDADIAWAADELRANIASHVDDEAREAVPLMHAQLGDALAILSDPTVLEAYGARDTWQLVDQLSRLELGGTRGVVRHQALAATATVILGWLASDGDPPGEDVADAAESFLTAAALP